MNVRFHSRHIPRELLNFQAPTGVLVRDNGLCDANEPEILAKLRAHGIEAVETRLVWWEIEPRPGSFDFSRFERDLDRIEKAGLSVGVFPWFQHPPAWYNEGSHGHVRFRCLEHGEDSTILSQWDAKTLEVYDRLYGELARRYGDRISFLYAGIGGDFGEVCYPSGVRHYLFSPPHNHEGFWCGDRLARQDFQRSMRRKYQSLGDLNAAWSTRFSTWNDDLMPTLPIRTHGLARRRDFADWYVGSLMRFTDAAAGLIRGHFPRTDIAVPLGFPFEQLWVGQIKSQAVKIAARHGMIARWTGMAFLESFERSNVLARRFASAAHFYGAPFATEAALTITRDNAANGLYEAFANGAMMIHDDPQNIFRAEDVHRRLRPVLASSPPICRAAVLYPLIDELLSIDDFDLNVFIDRAGQLRRRCDYDVCDELMIGDGYLDRFDDLLVLVPTVIGSAIVPLLQAFFQRGGRLWLCGSASLRVMDAEARLSDPTWPTKESLTNGRSAGGGVYRTDALPAITPFDEIQRGRDAGTYFTIHRDYVSCFSAEAGTIERWRHLPAGVEEPNP